MRIGVSGASGQLGTATVKELVQRGGHEIVGISRSPDKVAAPVVGRLGDYDQPETLAAAYAGLDRLLIIPSGEMAPGRRAAQSVAAIDAAVAAGVKHIVLMSSAGTREAQEPDIYASYWGAEQRLIRTAPRWTILRMNYYAEAFVQEAQMSLGGGVAHRNCREPCCVRVAGRRCGSGGGTPDKRWPHGRDLQRHRT